MITSKIKLILTVVLVLTGVIVSSFAFREYRVKLNSRAKSRGLQVNFNLEKNNNNSIGWKVNIARNQNNIGPEVPAQYKVLHCGRSSGKEGEKKQESCDENASDLIDVLVNNPTVVATSVGKTFELSHPKVECGIVQIRLEDPTDPNALLGSTVYDTGKSCEPSSIVPTSPPTITRIPTTIASAKIPSATATVSLSRVPTTPTIIKPSPSPTNTSNLLDIARKFLFLEPTKSPTVGTAITCQNCTSDVATLRNNIIWADGKALYVGGSSPVIESNNIFWSTDGTPVLQNCIQSPCGTFAISASSKKNVNPLFINATTLNFRLQSSSAAINVGSTQPLLAGYNMDLDNNIVPIGAS